MELAKLAKDLPTGHEVWTELSYLDKHGEAGHLDYARFRRRGVPLGSGAIESAIRRVVTLDKYPRPATTVPSLAEASFAGQVGIARLR